MAKNQPKAPDTPAADSQQGAGTPSTDTTEASNASGTELQQSNASTAGQQETKQPADGATQPAATPPEVTAPSAPQLREDGPTVREYVAAGYNAENYPPPGYASKSTTDEIQAAIDAQNAPLPKRIKLVTPYGFYDDANQLRMWQAGQETDDPDEIELLVTRGVECELLE